MNYSSDHVQPRSKGGSNNSYNKVPACKKCNVEKGCLPIDEYRAAIAFRRGLIKVDMKFFGEIENTKGADYSAP